MTPTTTAANRTVVHDSFTVERTYSHAVAKVFGAWADQAAKSQWFGDENITTSDYTLDFRVGGRESVSMTTHEGQLYTYDAVIMDIVDDSRIVHSYEMTVDGRRMSVSVATIEFFDASSADGSSTRLIMTEQGAFLDGLDTNADRAKGTAVLLEALGNRLDG